MKRPDDPDRMWHDREFLHSAAAVPQRPTTYPEPLLGSARWAEPDDINDLLRRRKTAHSTALGACAPLLASPDGSLEVRYNQTLWLGEELMNRHLLAIGQPGTGKTQSLLWPMVASAVRDRRRTVVVFDPKGDMYGPIAALAARAGRDPDDVWLLDITDPERTLAWNPVPDPLDRSTAYRIAHQYCHATEPRSGTSDSQFFLNQSVEFIANCLLGLSADDPESAALAKVQEVVDQPRERFLEFCSRHAEIPGLARFGAFLHSGSHNAETCAADVASRLLVFLDEKLCAVTGSRELDLDALATAPRVLVVQMREVDLGRLRPIYNVLLDRLVERLIRAADGSGGRLERPATLFLDEFASALGQLPDFEVRLNTLRSRRVSVVAAVQGLSQLRHLYGEGAGPLLTGFTSKVFFAGLEPADADYASRLSHTMTACHEVVEETRDRGGRVTGSRATRTAVGRPLLMPEEIALPPRHFEFGRPATFFLADRRPFQAFLTPAWKSQDLGGLFRRRDWPEFERRVPLVWGRTQRKVAGWARVAMVEAGLDPWRSSHDARHFWKEVKSRVEGPEQCLELIQKLRDAGADLREFHAAATECTSEDPMAVFHFMLYRRHGGDSERRNSEGPYLPF